ncbi:MAG: HD domain-containing protein [Caldilineaceae bacterium]|nr:HD domain-containing protein [Caldilineaceae bacterium]
MGVESVLDYFSIIHRYLAPDSTAYPLYLIHCTLVTKLALEIAERLELDAAAQRFIEEAAMLHDIGIVRTQMPVIFCDGALPYLYHLTEGCKLLEAEGLLKHARVAQTHSGIVLTAERLRSVGLTADLIHFIPRSLEEKIINFADLFYSKDSATLWRERSVIEARNSIGKFAPANLALFDEWATTFGVN